MKNKYTEKDLRCCGNCKNTKKEDEYDYERRCKFSGFFQHPSDVCIKWNWDRLTFSERKD